MTGPRTAYRADWVLPVGKPPVFDHVVVVDDRDVLDILPGSQWSETFVDLGRAAIIPGLVNAHTHLEFSDLEVPIGQPGIEFTEWISQVVDHRSKRPGDSGKRSAIRQGLLESRASGVVAVGEIGSLPVALDDYLIDGLEIQVFHELLGPNRPDNPHLKGCQSFLSTPPPQLGQGISPHAPYSLSVDLMQRAVRIARQQRLPVAMHVAETRQERELLEKQSGPFVELLKQLKAWVPDQFGKQRQMQHYLQHLSEAPRGLLIHGNYLTHDELDWISGQNGLHLVYCPRTHHYFGHDPYPLQAILERSINLAVGTDSRASNPDLNLFRELTFIQEQYPDLDALQILSLGTLNGARALGRERRLGSIEPGKSSRLAVIRCQEGAALDPGNSLDWLFSPRSSCHSLLFELPPA